MDGLAFLDEYTERGQSNATLKIVLPSGEVRQISDRICPFKFLDRCPLLYHAFEYGFQSRLQASIEALSEYAVVSLLRFCYTGSYIPPRAEYDPVSFLPHAETYKIAEDFDVPELQLLAHGNFSCQLEFACCVPAAPHDLVETIRFVYRHYASQQARRQHDLVPSLLNYCISNFLYHKLGEDAEFLKIAAEIPDFRQDLCRTNMGRNFQDECAFDIVRLCLDTLQVQPCVRPTVLASRDLPDEMICDTLPDTSSPLRYPPGENLEAVEYKAHEETDQDNMVDSGILTFVRRPKVAQPATILESDEECVEDDQGFTLVSRPKLQSLTTFDEPMSSPELTSPPAVDILAATGTDYSSDDEPMSSPELISTPVVDILAATGTDYSSDEEWTQI
ncbi:hypothetical protein J4E91_001044 [Alternaria rosae]|nr:hypothetical protein J4E91_001044 [Alternaria rosae]